MEILNFFKKRISIIKASYLFKNVNFKNSIQKRKFLESILESAKIVKKEVDETNKRIAEDYERKQFKDIQLLVDKYFNKENKKLHKEIKRLNNVINNKNSDIKNLKSRLKR